VQAVYTNELAAGVQIIHSFDDAGKVLLLPQDCLSAVTPACDHQHIVQAVCYTNEQGQGTIHVIHSFDDAGKIWCWDCSQTSSQHAVSLGVTPQRAIINMSGAAVCYTNELAAGVQFMHLFFDDAGKICCRTAQPAVNMLSRL
jgi:hypothetical protein